MKAGIAEYHRPNDLPDVVPVFPLSGALLLPRGQMPLNVFEPRYLRMVDSAVAGDRVIGIIQPDAGGGSLRQPALHQIGCAGRITAFAESNDGRYLVTLTGIARFRVIEEVAVDTPYRQCRITAAPYADDFIDRAGEEEVDRDTLLGALRAYLEAHNLEADWDSVDTASNEALVNGMAMLSPYGPAEKQALLEAPDLKTRAETLVALTEISLAKDSPSGRTLQ